MPLVTFTETDYFWFLVPLGIPCEPWVLLLRRGLWLVVTLGVNLPLGPLGNLALLWENAAPLVRRDIRLVPLLANPAKEIRSEKMRKNKKTQ